MITEGIQTLSKKLGDYGCYFICLCKFIEQKKNEDLDILALSQFAIANNWIRGDFAVINPSEMLTACLGKKYEVKIVTTKPETADCIINCWRNERTGLTHFTMDNFDPLVDSVTVKEGKIVSYRVINEVKQ